MGKPIRVAIVGTGAIAKSHAEALASLGDEAEIAAGVDIDASRLVEFCDRHGIPGRYPALDQMLAAEHPQLVHICAPPGLHRELARGCLRAGASVLVEKPPALSLAELHEMADAQGTGGPWLATVFQHRFGSGAANLRSLMDSGLLGRPLLAVCHTTWYRAQEYFDVPWRGRFDTEGGGPTMGHGIHQMDLLAAILGDWTEIRAVARRQARRTGTEDLSLAHVSFANGAVATVVNSLVSPRQETYLRFDFEYGTVELTHLYGYGDGDWRVTPAPGHDEVLDAWRAGESGRRSGHRAQLALVLSALRNGTAPPVSTADAWRTMTLVAGIYASAFGDRPVTPADLGPDSPYYDRMDGNGVRWPAEEER